jgi:hypothetical protein
MPPAGAGFKLQLAARVRTGASRHPRQGRAALPRRPSFRDNERSDILARPAAGVTSRIAAWKQ